MSLGSIKGGQPAVLDLLAVSTPTPEPRREVPRKDRGADEGSPRFGDVLSESASRERRANRGREQGDKSAQSVESSEPAKPTDSTQDEQPQATDNDPNKAEQQGSDDESAKAESQTESEGTADESAAELEAQAAAEAGAAQAKEEQVGALQFGLNQAPTGVKAVQTPAELEAYAGSAAEKQAQAAAAQAAQESIARHQGKPGAPLQNTVVLSTTTVQPQGEQASTSDGNAQGESSSTSAQAVTPSQTQANASAASAAFALPDQPASEARLPVNPTATTQIDASKLVAAQPLTAEGDNDSLNTSRLRRGLANAVQQRGGAVTLRLTPPEMGTVRIQMQISGANLSATFHAETPSAQALLTKQLSQLRTSLESQGMNVERLSVQAMAATSQSQNASNNNQGDSQQQNQGQQQSANDGRSRGQYGGSSGGRSSDGQQDSDNNNQQAPRGFFDRLSDAADPSTA